MYPDADIPVVQLSIDFNSAPEAHFEIGKKLSQLRKEGVFIIGSGKCGPQPFADKLGHERWI